MEYQMIHGAYQQGGYGWCPFVGIIVLDEKSGYIDGTIKDPFGEAVIQGEKRSDMIGLDKCYKEAGRFGSITISTDPVAYRLFPEKNGIQWKGDYRLESGNTGIVLCTIFPYTPSGAETKFPKLIEAVRRLHDRIGSSIHL